MLLFAVPVYAQTNPTTVQHTFKAGDDATADQVNQNFKALADGINGVSKEVDDIQKGVTVDPGTGNLLVKATDLTASNLFGGASYKIAAGQTIAGNTNWIAYGTIGIYVDVDTRAAGFSATPIYVVSLHGSSGHWGTTGGSNPYDATKDGFRVHIRYSDGSSITPTEANASPQLWHIQWIGVQQ
jgi:hypothetical protein